MTTLDKHTKVPLYVVVSAISLAIIGTLEYADLRYQIRQTTKDCMTQTQMQDWINEAWKANKTSNPSVVFPVVPKKGDEFYE